MKEVRKLWKYNPHFDLAFKFRKTRILVIEFLSLHLETIDKTIVRVITISSRTIDCKQITWNGSQPDNC